MTAAKGHKWSADTSPPSTEWSRRARHVVMYQQGRDLLFLQWEYSPREIQARLPEGLA
jgi:hypothetical protein